MKKCHSFLLNLEENSLFFIYEKIFRDIFQTYGSDDVYSVISLVRKRLVEDYINLSLEENLNYIKNNFENRIFLFESESFKKFLDNFLQILNIGNEELEFHTINNVKSLILEKKIIINSGLVKETEKENIKILFYDGLYRKIDAEPIFELTSTTIILSFDNLNTKGIKYVRICVDNVKCSDYLYISPILS